MGAKKILMLVGDFVETLRKREHANLDQVETRGSQIRELTSDLRFRRIYIQ